MLIQSKQSRARSNVPSHRSSSGGGGSRTYGSTAYSTGGLLTPAKQKFADQIAAMNAAAYRSWRVIERKEVEIDWSDPESVLQERFGPLCNPTYDGPATDLSGTATGEQSWMVTINGTRHVYVNVGWENGVIVIRESDESRYRGWVSPDELERVSQAEAILTETKFYIGVAFESESAK